jgi:hypothetical protein
VNGFLLLEFATADAASDAARLAAEAGAAAEDVLFPVPIDGIVEHLRPAPPANPVGTVMIAAGILGAFAAYAMEWYSAVIDFPLLSGGRPLNSWPAFLPVPYEAAILSAGVTGILSWLWMCGLPRPHHPLFESLAVERAVQDRYFLVFSARDDTARVALTLWPLAVHEITP